MRYTLTMAGTLTLFWLINSGHYSALLLCFGALSVLLVTWISHRMDMVDHEAQPVHLLSRIPRYLLWLSWQIVLSNIDLARRVWRPGPTTDPALVRLPLPQKSDICRVVYANSINLTPGTLTIDLGDDYLLVHALSHKSIEELERGDMAARVADLEH